MQNATFTAVRDHRAGDPVDIETIHEVAEDVIATGARIEDADEMITIILLLRGAIMLLIPEVEIVSAKHPRDHIPCICARACIGEARMRLRLGPGENHTVRLATAQRLARSVKALVEHYRKLGGDS